MKFWDSSAIVPLIVADPRTSALQRLYQRDAAVLVWWATEIECVSAVARLERQQDLTARAALESFRRLDALKTSWNEVQPLDGVRRIARRLLRVHSLRAADSFQLAAALVASEGQPGSLEMVSLDDRLVDAGRREGLEVIEVEGGE